MSKENWKIFVIAGGFYYFGEEVDAPEGYVALKQAAMFGGFTGGKGLPGVATGNKEMKINLDRFEASEVCMFPLTSCYGILPSTNLYEFKGTTIRK